MPPIPTLICSPRLLKKLNTAAFANLQVFPDDLPPAAWRRVRRQIDAGGDLIVIGNPTAQRLEPLWIHRYTIADVKARLTFCDDPPLPLTGARLASAPCQYAYLNSPHQHPIRIGTHTVVFNTYHGIDEEPRADLLALIEARDPFGKLLGYPAVLLKHNDSALVSGRFRGGRWAFFFFDHPEKIMPARSWQNLIAELLAHFQPRVGLSHLTGQYASYDPGETARLTCRITNTGPRPALCRVRLHAVVGNAKRPRLIGEQTQTVNAGDTAAINATCRIPATAARALSIEATLRLADFAHRHTEPTFRPIDRQHCRIIIRQAKPPAHAPRVSLHGTQIKIGSDAGFLVGTHHYLTQDFFESLWRDLRPDILHRDLAVMRDHGLRFIRLWADPVLDEHSLRGLDAAMQLCQEHGLAVILTIFSQWPSYLVIDSGQIRQQLLFHGPDDGNLHSICLRGMPFQRRYAQLLASRYKNVPGLIWNLSNELALIDPRPEQFAAARDWLDPKLAQAPPPHNAIAVAQAWLTRIRTAVCDAGAEQPIIASYNCTYKNGDSYFTNQIGDIATYHDYSPNLQYIAPQDTTCFSKPLLLEEFGVRATSAEQQRDHYDHALHYALGMPLAGACSYEWGVSSLMRRLPTHINHMTRATRSQDPTNLCHNGPASHWPTNALGLAPYAASFIFGMTYHLTAVPNDAMLHLCRAAWIGRRLAYHPHPKPVYLIVPLEFAQNPQPGRGRSRKDQLITETITALRRRHVPFTIIPAPQLHSLPEAARVLIVPCQDPPTAQLRKQLDKHRRAGRAVYLGRDTTWQNTDLPGRIAIRPDHELDLLTRDIFGGSLLVLHNRAGKKRRLHITTPAGRQVKLTIDTFAMIGETRRRITLIESSGTCEIDGRRLFDTTRGRVIVQSLDGRSLEHSRRRLVLPVEPTTLKLPHATTPKEIRAKVVDYPDRCVGQLTLKRRGDNLALPLTAALLRHGVCLET